MNIEQLLNQVSAINKRYAEIAKISGENFNIFEVLGLTSDEISHSRVIAMLINPCGEHNMGYSFLKLFIETIAGEKWSDDEYCHSEVETEKSSKSGRVDILISSGKRQILIENKIYAQDQDRQLMRYHEDYPDASILYLTLKGIEPSGASAKGLNMGTDYKCISYEKNILAWLETCKKETVNVPFLRETINQYILLVKQLTGQSRSEKMNAEILDAITANAETLTSAWAINGLTRSAVLRHIVENKVVPDLKKMANQNGLDFEETKDAGNIFANEYGFRFSNKKQWGNIFIWFAFGPELRDLRSCIRNSEGYLTDIWEESPQMKYKDWHWDKGETIAQLCTPSNDVIKEIENIIINELIPKVEALISKQ